MGLTGRVSTVIPRSAAEYFGDRVAHYDSRYDSNDADGHALRARLDAVNVLVGTGTGELLDAGMGPGRLCRDLAARGWRVSGVDASVEMVEVARARLPEEGGRFHCARIEALPFDAESFDVVTATGVLEYADVPAALGELRRVLRPGGRAVVSYPNPHAIYGIWKTRLWYPLVRVAKRILRRPNPQMPHGAGELPPPVFRAALGRAGLEPVATVYTSYLPVITPFDRMLPRTTARLGRRLEGRGGVLGSLIATQVVYEARISIGKDNA
jgi:2-polyprenyl-3-methyl-5-hydroxy-6-metoxy-1,4-benzoquinol methylase